MNDKKINIVITDDHRLFRKGMVALLEDFEWIDSIYEAANGVELLTLLRSLNELPDLVLLDIQMPELDGVEATHRIREMYPELPIIILSMEDDAQLVMHLVNEGVNGYLLKNADPDELELALKLVMKNDFYFSGSLTRALSENSSGTIKPKSKKPGIELSERELEVLQLICKELTAVEIAGRLSLSARTIEGYKCSLLEKTATRNMAGLVIFALKNQLVEC